MKRRDHRIYPDGTATVSPSFPPEPLRSQLAAMVDRIVRERRAERLTDPVTLSRARFVADRTLHAESVCVTREAQRLVPMAGRPRC